MDAIVQSGLRAPRLGIALVSGGWRTEKAYCGSKIGHKLGKLSCEPDFGRISTSDTAAARPAPAARATKLGGTFGTIPPKE